MSTSIQELVGTDEGYFVVSGTRHFCHCLICDGEGWLLNEDTDCPYCDGSGKILFKRFIELLHSQSIREVRGIAEVELARERDERIEMDCADQRMDRRHCS